MKKSLIMLGVLLVFIIGTMSILGCGSGSRSLSLIEMAKMMPSYISSIAYTNLTALEAENLYAYNKAVDYFEGEVNEFNFGQNHFELIINDVDLIGIQYSLDIYIIGGKFDVENIRDILLQDNYQKENLFENEIWILPAYDEAVIVLNDILIVSHEDDAREICGILSNNSPSAYDGISSDVQSIFDELPVGIIMFADSLNRQEPFGGTITKESSSLYELNMLGRIQDQEQFESQSDWLKAEWENQGLWDVDFTFLEGFLNIKGYCTLEGIIDSGLVF